MPCPPVEGYELRHLSIARNQQVSRYLQLVYLAIIGMLIRIQTVGEQLPYTGTSELPRRQADIVNQKQRDLSTRPLIDVGRGTVLRADDKVVLYTVTTIGHGLLNNSVKG